MTKLIPLREVAHLRLVLPTDEVGIAGLPWLPVSHTELHLACLYFPLAVSFKAGQPCLGLVLGAPYLRYPAVDAAGTLPVTVVPRPGADWTVSPPPSAPMRSVMFCTPALEFAAAVS